MSPPSCCPPWRNAPRTSTSQPDWKAAASFGSAADAPRGAGCTRAVGRCVRVAVANAALAPRGAVARRCLANGPPALPPLEHSPPVHDTLCAGGNTARQPTASWMLAGGPPGSCSSQRPHFLSIRVAEPSTRRVGRWARAGHVRRFLYYVTENTLGSTLVARPTGLLCWVQGAGGAVSSTRESAR